MNNKSNLTQNTLKYSAEIKKEQDYLDNLIEIWGYTGTFSM